MILLSENNGREAAPPGIQCWILTLTPLAFASAMAPLAALTSFTRASFHGTALEDVFWSYFFVSYPFFLFAILYGMARLVLLGSVPGRGRIPRLILLPVALAMFAGACLYPTFGGLVLRAGFAVGGIGFLHGQTAWLSLVLGATAAALIFTLALGTASLMLKGMCPAWSGIRGSAIGLIALVYAGNSLGAVQRWLLPEAGTWPIAPLPLRVGLLTALALIFALLPHAIATREAFAQVSRRR